MYTIQNQIHIDAYKKSMNIKKSRSYQSIEILSLRYVSAFFCACFGMGCVEEEIKASFPDGLQPLSEMRIDVPSEGYEEENWISSSQDEGDYAWAQGRGYIHGSIDDVWERLRLPEVFINHDEVVEYHITNVVPPEYDYHFIAYNRSENIVDVEFENEWRHGALENRNGNIERVGVRWQKISGTEFIQSLEGSIQILAIDNAEIDVVEVQVIEHLTATLNQEDNAKAYIDGLWERWH